MQKTLDRKAKIRVWLAFLFLFVCLVALSVGVYYVSDLSQLQDRLAAQESRQQWQSATDPKQVDEPTRRPGSDKISQMIAMALKAAGETGVAADKLSTEIEPASLAKGLDVVTASRADLETLRNDLKLAEAHASGLMPRFVALLKAERDQLEAYAVSLHVGKDSVGRFLGEVDQRHAEFADVTSRLLSARADYYRAYERYVAVLDGEFGAYKVVGGQLLFPLQSTWMRYNAAANAMTAAGKRVTDLDDERTRLMASQREQWRQTVSGK